MIKRDHIHASARMMKEEKMPREDVSLTGGWHQFVCSVMIELLGLVALRGEVENRMESQVVWKRQWTQSCL